MTLFKRIIKAGLLGFYRNKTVSLSSILILTVTLSIVSAFFFFKEIFYIKQAEIKSKVDIRMYFTVDASETDIQQLVSRIQQLPEINKVEFTSKEETLNNFKAEHVGETDVLAALEELGENPFGASLTIYAKDTNLYEGLAQKIDSDSFLGDNKGIVEKINYLKLKSRIDRLNEIINWINAVGFWMVLVFLVMSALIVYNTIRIAIYVYREEISVMRLVGASNTYIQGPFVVEAIVYGVLATLVTLILYYPLTAWIADKTKSFLGGIDVYSIYINNIFYLGFILLVFGTLLTVIASYLAVRKYLKL